MKSDIDIYKELIKYEIKDKFYKLKKSTLEYIVSSFCNPILERNINLMQTDDEIKRLKDNFDSSEEDIEELRKCWTLDSYLNTNESIGCALIGAIKSLIYTIPLSIGEYSLLDEPQRTMPIAITLSVPIITNFYSAFYEILQRKKLEYIERNVEQENSEDETNLENDDPEDIVNYVERVMNEKL
ncbi:hypothetical protein COU57_01055 [Candidatus Pacearchaeota archaeon CG10_big_fil_rev_8_21_14_0_10_32_14]|nr:MAG: hypothetical protein COU57_01055 [Candidatus Pacearchaeota archaeon CG10_big_fil_rev_8_21_14_0_10_32_14]